MANEGNNNSNGNSTISIKAAQAMIDNNKIEAVNIENATVNNASLTQPEGAKQQSQLNSPSQQYQPESQTAGILAKISEQMNTVIQMISNKESSKASKESVETTEAAKVAANERNPVQVKLDSSAVSVRTLGESIELALKSKEVVDALSDSITEVINSLGYSSKNSEQAVNGKEVSESGLKPEDLLEIKSLLEKIDFTNLSIDDSETFKDIKAVFDKLDNVTSSFSETVLNSLNLNAKALDSIDKNIADINKTILELRLEKAAALKSLDQQRVNEEKAVAIEPGFSDAHASAEQSAAANTAEEVAAKNVPTKKNLTIATDTDAQLAAQDNSGELYNSEYYNSHQEESEKHGLTIEYGGQGEAFASGTSDNMKESLLGALMEDASVNANDTSIAGMLLKISDSDIIGAGASLNAESPLKASEMPASAQESEKFRAGKEASSNSLVNGIEKKLEPLLGMISQYRDVVNDRVAKKVEDGKNGKANLIDHLIAIKSVVGNIMNSKKESDEKVADQKSKDAQFKKTSTNEGLGFGSFKSMSKFFKDLGGTLKNMIPVPKAISDGLSKFKEGVKKAAFWTTLITGLIAAIGFLKTHPELLKKILDVAKTVLSTIWSVLKNVWNSIKPYIMEGLSFIGDLLKKGISKMSYPLMGSIGGLLGFAILGPWGLIIGTVSAMLLKLAVKVGNIGKIFKWAIGIVTALTLAYKGLITIQNAYANVCKLLNLLKKEETAAKVAENVATGAGTAAKIANTTATGAETAATGAETAAKIANTAATGTSAAVNAAAGLTLGTVLAWAIPILLVVGLAIAGLISYFSSKEETPKDVLANKNGTDALAAGSIESEGLFGDFSMDSGNSMNLNINENASGGSFGNDNFSSFTSSMASSSSSSRDGVLQRLIDTVKKSEEHLNFIGYELVKPMKEELLDIMNTCLKYLETSLAYEFRPNNTSNRSISSNAMNVNNVQTPQNMTENSSGKIIYDMNQNANNVYTSNGSSFMVRDYIMPTSFSSEAVAEIVSLSRSGITMQQAYDEKNANGVENKAMTPEIIAEGMSLFFKDRTPFPVALYQEKNPDNAKHAWEQQQQIHKLPESSTQNAGENEGTNKSNA